MRRRMQWSSSTATILISLLLLLIPIIVHGFINEEGDEGRKEHKMSLELVHRHDARFFGGGGGGGNVVDQLEAIKGFIQRDTLRRQRLNQRWGVLDNHYHNRRKNWETFQMPMHSGRDYGLGEYFVEVEVGTPGQKFWLVADSGNELTWFNCLHRNHSGGGGVHKKQHKRRRSRTRTRRRRSRTRTRARRSKPCNGVFCPHRSRSFQQVTCSSHKCKVELSDLFSLSYCPRPSDPCLYDIRLVILFSCLISLSSLLFLCVFICFFF